MGKPTLSATARAELTRCLEQEFASCDKARRWLNAARRTGARPRPGDPEPSDAYFMALTSLFWRLETLLAEPKDETEI
jgi:hypothetical protein